MAEITQVRCPACGIVYSERAISRHQEDGRCLRPEGLGLAYGPEHTWVLPEEIQAKVTCPRCGVAFTQAAHDAHRDDSTPLCATPEAMGLVLDATLRAWRYPDE